jgi:hypothetical protein
MDEQDVRCDSPEDKAALIRRLIRGGATAVLATAVGDSGWPYASLVLTACDHDAAPLVLISKLAEHTKNIAADDRVSLLFDGTEGLEHRLTGPRASVQGRAAPTEDRACRERFLRRHPEAAEYVDFADFGFYRIAVERAHLVAGFGRVFWTEAAELALGLPPTGALDEAEASIVAHMNEDHAEAVGLYATRLAGQAEGAWVMTGCDVEGFDLRCAQHRARLDFDGPVAEAEAARQALVGLARKARGGRS